MTSENTQLNLVSRVYLTCREILTTTVDKLNQKYRQDHYVSRAEAEQMFQRFAESDKALFLVLGDSGHGKTNLMCHLGQLSIETRPTLFLMGMWRSDVQENIFEYVFKRLKASTGHEATELWSFIRDLNEQLDREKSSLLVIIDGINETDDPLWVKRGIRELLTKCPKSIRFAVSCRTDSFRLHFQEDFWADYVYQEGAPLEKVPDDTQLQEALKRRVKARFERSLSPEQREAVETALVRQRQAQQLRRAKRLRELATEGSIFLSQFNETEFSTALLKYQITATLVGEALDQTHNPLVFRFFAETVGREAREVSDVFTLKNAERYWKKHIREVVDKGHEEKKVKQFLYRIATECREEYFKGSDGTTTSTAKTLEDSNLIDSFQETGLLMHWGEAQSGTIRFTFDRVLSFVLASQAVDLGHPGVTKRLRKLSRIWEPPAIDLHQCIYLLLFNEELRLASDQTNAKDWTRVFLDKPAFRPHVIQVLPEFSSWSTAVILEEIKSFLLATPSVKPLDGEDSPPYLLQPLSPSTTVVIDACADALATMARKGHAADVIQLVEKFLSYCPKEERLHVFHSLVRPIAVSFTNAPERCMEILKQLCGSEAEIDLAVMISGPTESTDEMSFFSRGLSIRRSPHTNERGGIFILQQEVSSFPQARLPLIVHLASSPWAVFRSVAATALPGLFTSSRAQGRQLIEQFVNDSDFRVRVDLAQTAAQLSEFDPSTASELCLTLLDDRDERVRSALVHSIVGLSKLGDAKFDFLLTDALSDESTYIRSVLGTTLIDALTTQLLETTTEDLFKTCLRVLAKDKSYLVRSVIAMRQGPAIPKSPAFWLDLSLNALSDDTPPSFRILVIDSLAKAEVSWEMVPEQANFLAVEITKDPDASVRRRGVYLLIAMADRGIEQAKESLNLLVDDPELLVRLETLKAQANSDSESLSQAILRAGERLHTSNPRQKKIEPHYINALVDGKIKALKGRELIERSLRNVGAVSLLVPFLIFTGITGWKVSWLGHLGDDRYTSNPRYSFTPIIIGLFVATVVVHIQRWLDLYYYSRRTVTMLRTMWPYLFVPALLSVASGIVSRYVMETDLSLLIGLGTLIVAMPISALAVNRKYQLSSPPWSREGIAYTFAVGYFSGVAGGWLAEFTRESFYGFFMLICPLLLSLRLSERNKRAISDTVLASILVSLVPILAFAISASQLFSNAQIYLWLVNHFGVQAASAGILATTMATFCLAGILFDEEEWTVLVVLFTFVLVLLGLWLIMRLTFSDSILAAILASTIVTLIVGVTIDATDFGGIVSFGENELTLGLIVLLSAYWIGLYAQPFVKAPWLLPGISVLIIAVFSILRWSSARRYSYNDPWQDGSVSYEPLRQAIKFSVVTLPALCSFVIMTATILLSIASRGSLPSFTELSVVLAVTVGLAVTSFDQKFDFGTRPHVLQRIIPMLFVIAGSFCCLLLYLQHRLGALVVLLGAVMFYLALLTRSLLRATESLPRAVAFVAIPPICFLLVSLNISLYVSYLGSFLILLGLGMLVSRTTLSSAGGSR